ncbi:RecB family exonuclease [Pelovirga terrestris]|uniref:PD-(D/E)XK nuclease family protein n=1 Tax=Pelovirga terrestris TaxID=2771352 RepID=A0A8J6URT0_9BACT|nr:PD-(D/E)XK nuclease family protein [Pelovirga terrestris]MBD1401866.1 PD-(D/E)XK nuclease family protein [Pelovirga terrestris]
MTQSLRALRHQLHLSYSQINTYLTCSLRYFFQYVKGFAPEHTSSALILGSTIHASLARYYDGIKEKGEAESPDSLLEFYRDSMAIELATPRAPVMFGNDAGNADELLALGERLLRAYLDNPGFNGMEVVATELPLSMPLVTPDGRVTDFHLIGAVDLLLRDQLGRLLAVDHKTARNALTQEAIDQDLQLSAYTLLLQHNGYVEPEQALHCCYNVIRKLKTPKVEKHLTTRTAADTERFNRIANAVLSGIEAEVFLPCTGWQCSGCPYQEQCNSW